MKRSGFKFKPRKPLRRTKINVVGHSETADIKKVIQGLVREIGIIRDGGCVLRHYPQAGACGGHRKDGELILQAEHYVTRANSATFGDMRNIGILCQHHHGNFKPQHSRLYWDLIRQHIGEQMWEWIKRVEEDRTAHKIDWKLVEIDLRMQLAKYNLALLT